MIAQWLDKKLCGGPAAVKVAPKLVFHQRWYSERKWYDPLAYVSLMDHRGWGYELHWKHFKFWA